MCLDHRPLHTSKKATSLQLFSEARTVVALIDRTRSLVSSGCTIFAASSGTVQSTEKANSMHYLEVHTWNDLNDIVELPAKGNTEAHNRARACIYHNHALYMEGYFEFPATAKNVHNSINSKGVDRWGLRGLKTPPPRFLIKLIV